MPTLLLLDDEPHVLSSLRRALRQPLGEDVKILTFIDPHAALNHLCEHAVDLVMTDFRMPAMSGLQFLHFVRELQPDAVRMIVSASTDVSSVIDSINEVGVFRYVVKPWSTGLLIEDVKAALDKARTGREQRRLADAMRERSADAAPPDEIERRRLEALEPGLTHVEWGPNGEVLMPPLTARVD